MREIIVQKSVPHVQHDYFGSFNQYYIILLLFGVVVAVILLLFGVVVAVAIIVS